jgi:hypothetical protein
MKPFNLEEAVELHKPVVTRDGRDVWLAGYNPEAEEHCRIIGWVDGGIYFWKEDGTSDLEANGTIDLFMKSTDAYVGFYTFTNKNGIIVNRTTEHCHPTEEEAQEVLNKIVNEEFWNDIQNRQVIKISI